VLEPKKFHSVVPITDSASRSSIRATQTAGISIKSETIFYDDAMVLPSYSAMTAAGRASVVVPASNAKPHQNLRRTAASRSPRARRQEWRAKTARLAVVLSLFLVLLIAALFIGGRSVIEPMLHKAMAQATETHRRGEIVFTLPDGTFCRNLAFDNKTAELTESTVLQCPEARPREPARPPSGFAWGAH
jgi:hypothetical protein